MDIEEKLSQLTFKQAKFLARLADSMDRAGYPFGREESGVVATLAKEGFVVKYGKNGALQRWQLKDEFFKNLATRTYLRELAKSADREGANV